MTAATSGSTSPSLVSRVQARDPHAWQRLADLYSPLVYDWARQAGLQASDAQDVVQETFRAVATAINEFHRDRPGDSFRGWLWTVTRNRIQDHFRANADRADAEGGSVAYDRLQKLPDAPPAESADGRDPEVFTGLAHRALQIIQTDFDEKTWQAFWRMTIDEQKSAAVAQELGMTKKAVRQAKYRVLRRLRQELT